MKAKQLFSELRSIMMKEVNDREDIILLARGRKQLFRQTPEYDYYMKDVPGVFLDVEVGTEDWGLCELVITNENGVLHYNVRLGGDDKWSTSTEVKELPINRMCLWEDFWEVAKFWLMESYNQEDITRLDLDLKHVEDDYWEPYPGELCYDYDHGKRKKTYYYFTHTKFPYEYNKKFSHFMNVCTAIFMHNEASYVYEVDDYHPAYEARYNTHPADKAVLHSEQ